jgi:mRNA interferase RelE/StbE
MGLQVVDRNIAKCDIAVVKDIVFTPSAFKQWTKLSADIRARINRRLMIFAETGNGDVKRLKGRPGCRLRVGDWRVIFDETADTIVVAAVGHRRGVYD